MDRHKFWRRLEDIFLGLGIDDEELNGPEALKDVAEIMDLILENEVESFVETALIERDMRWIVG